MARGRTGAGTRALQGQSGLSPWAGGRLEARCRHRSESDRHRCFEALPPSVGWPRRKLRRPLSSLRVARCLPCTTGDPNFRAGGWRQVPSTSRARLGVVAHRISAGAAQFAPKVCHTLVVRHSSSPWHRFCDVGGCGCSTLKLSRRVRRLQWPLRCPSALPTRSSRRTAARRRFGRGALWLGCYRPRECRGAAVGDSRPTKTSRRPWACGSQALGSRVASSDVSHLAAELAWALILACVHELRRSTIARKPLNFWRRGQGRACSAGSPTAQDMEAASSVVTARDAFQARGSDAYRARCGCGSHEARCGRPRCLAGCWAASEGERLR